jgi:hypothetical protein
MHPDITKTIAAMRVDDKHAAAAAARQARQARLARQARQARAGLAAASLPVPGSAAVVGGPDTRLQRLLGRWIPGRPQPA